MHDGYFPNSLPPLSYLPFLNKKQLKYLGTDESIYCECNSRAGHSKCQAVSRVDIKELESYEYVPKPIDVSDEHLLQLGQPLDNEIQNLINKKVIGNALDK